MSRVQNPEPRLPEVGEYVRLFGRLVEVQDVTPPPPEKVLDYIFESTNARVASRVNGKVIKEFATLNDFYGEGTCVQLAIEDARDAVAEFGRCELEIVVVKITSRSRFRPTAEVNFYDRQYVEFSQHKIAYRDGDPDDTEEVVWSNAGPARWIKSLRDTCEDGAAKWPGFWCSRCGRMVCTFDRNAPEKVCHCEPGQAD